MAFEKPLSKKNTSAFNSASQIRNIFKLNISLLQKTICGGIITVLTFDALAVIATNAFKFPYSYATIGTAIIYTSIGHSLSRQYNMPWIISTAIIICIIDILLSTDIASFISPESIPDNNSISLDSYAAYFFNRDTLSGIEALEIHSSIRAFMLVLGITGGFACFGANLQMRIASSRSNA